MDYIHVVNGDLAARLLGEALDRVGRRDRIVVFRDDLAIGPLRSIDDSSSARITFWQKALGAGEHGISQAIIDAFDASAITLKELAHEDRLEVVTWHAQNAGDQLMLRRIAYHLRNTPQRLNEIGFKSRFLVSCESARTEAAASTATEATGKPACAPDDGCTADALAERLHAIAPISLLRISRLALEWQELKQLDHELRRWRDNTFQSGLFTDVDSAITEYATHEWQSYLAIARRIRAADPGCVATDALIAWRCRELANVGRLSMDNDPILEKTTQVRLN